VKSLPEILQANTQPKPTLGAYLVSYDLKTWIVEAESVVAAVSIWQQNTGHTDSPRSVQRLGTSPVLRGRW
jgi:hypothetical protein